MQKTNGKIISREDIYKLVDIFYQHEFKTFYINSIDGKNFVKPVGIFVSLGLTTSIATLDNMKNILIDNGYIARIAEISSKKVNSQYMNSLTSNETPEQYKITPSKNVLDENEAKAELKRLESLLSIEKDLETLAKTASRVSSLRKLIEKLSGTNGWKDHLVKVDSETCEYSIFHKNVNYKKDSDLEYRIGLYVVNKE